MRILDHLSRIATLVPITTLCACGGGGGGAEGSTQTTAGGINAHAAWVSYLQGGRTLVVTGSGFNFETLRDDTFEYTFTFLPATGATFPPSQVTGSSMTLRTTIRSGPGFSSITPTSDVDTYFNSNYQLLGRRWYYPNTLDHCFKATSVSTPPVASLFLGSGPIAKHDDLDSCTTAGQPTGETTVETWSAPVDAGITFFCANQDNYDASTLPFPASRSSLRICIEADANGTLGTRAKVTIDDLPMALTLKNF